jgi:hypothetical protein
MVLIQKSVREHIDAKDWKTFEAHEDISYVTSHVWFYFNWRTWRLRKNFGSIEEIRKVFGGIDIYLINCPRRAKHRKKQRRLMKK